MAFLDKLKGAAEKAKEAAKNAAIAAAKAVDQVAEKQRQADEDQRKADATAKANEAAVIKERLLANYRYKDWNDEDWKKYCELVTEEEADELDAIIDAKREADRKDELISRLNMLKENTDCDLGVGDCIWHGDKFYCTCGDNVDCPRKKHIKARQLGQIQSLDHWAHIKLASGVRIIRVFDNVHYMCYTKGYQDSIRFEDLLQDFFDKFLPNCQLSDDEDVERAKYSQRMNDNYEKCEELTYLCEHGLGKDNPVMNILYTINKKTNGQLKMSLPKLVRFARACDIDMQQEFFMNPSLYQRSYADFWFTAKILDAASDVVKAVDAFTHPDKVDVNALYNADGTIKEAGIGGPKNGFYGDVIYNIVSTWNEEE